MVISWLGVSRSIQVVDPDKQACVSEIFIFHPECGGRGREGNGWIFLNWMGRAGVFPGHCLPPEMTALMGSSFLGYPCSRGNSSPAFALAQPQTWSPGSNPQAWGPQHPTRDSLFCLLLLVSSGVLRSTLKLHVSLGGFPEFRKAIILMVMGVRVSSWGRMQVEISQDKRNGGMVQERAGPSSQAGPLSLGRA